MNISAAIETCNENPFLIALADGISHTDIGLTLATIFLAIVTWNLIDDRKQARILRHFVPSIKVSRHVKMTRTITSADGASTKDEAEASETVEE